MTQPPNEKPNNFDPQNIISASMGGLPKFIQRIIDKNGNNIPDVIENIDVKKLKVNGKSFTNWQQVIAEFKNIKNSSQTKPLDISLGQKQETQNKPAGFSIEKKQQAPSSLSRPFQNDKPKPIKVGGGFAFIKILLALATIGIVIYYISKAAS